MLPRVVGAVGSGNIEVVRRAFAAFAQRDAAGLVAVCSTDVVFDAPTARYAGGQPYRGHDGLRRYLADVASVWQELRPEPDRFQELDDELVLCTGRVYAWGAGRVVDSPAGWLWRLRDGLIVEGSVYDTARAAVAAGDAALARRRRPA